MTAWRSTLRRLLAVLRRARLDRDLDDEIQGHLELAAARYVEQGLAPDDARFAALRDFGGVARTKDAHAELRSLVFVDALLQDVRYAIRTLRRSPGFAAIAVVSLALGIGASTAVFSVVNTVLLQPLPYPNAERLVIPWKLAPRLAGFAYDVYPWSPREFRVLRTLSSFESFGVFKGATFNLTGRGEPVSLKGLRVSYGFLPALGTRPALGRWFLPEEDQPGRAQVVMLSDQLWRERFGADPAIAGRAIDLDGVPHTVVGVMPADFSFPRAEEMPSFFDLPRRALLWVPLAVPAAPHGPEPSELASVARLRAGSSRAQAQADLDANFSAHMDDEFPKYKGYFQSRLTPLAAQITRQARRPLLLVLCAVVLVLSIATANVANLSLARSLNRRNEFAVRAALGAGRGRLTRQLLTESVLLAVVAGGAGVLAARAGIAALKGVGPPSLTRLQDVTLDSRVLLFGLAASVAAGVLFGLVPAMKVGSGELAGSFKAAGPRVGADRATTRMRNALVVGEIAVAIVLAVVASLLTRTFVEMVRTDPGFRTARVLTFELTLPTTKYPDQTTAARAFVAALDQLRLEAAIEDAGMAQVVPLGGAPDSTTVRVLGRPAPPSDADQPYAAYTLASPGFFAALGVPVVSGRDLLPTDRADSMRVVVINRAMRAKFFGDDDPVGAQIDFANASFPPMTIVGVVGDVKQESLRESPMPRMYAPLTQKTWTPTHTMQVAVRSRGDAATAARAVRDAIRRVDPALPVSRLSTLDALVRESAGELRFAMLLLGAFGSLASVLAAIGLYGSLSYLVTQRTREIGLRVAIGATRGDVGEMIAGQAATLTALGTVIGVALAFVATRLIAGFLYGVTPTDPSTFAGVIVVLALVAAAASCLPAIRAMRVDPVVALRDP